MLKSFEVTGFKNFQNTFSMDFSKVRDYKFNESCIKNSIIGNAIIYGKNSSGKTNWGLALFDIVSHLTSNNVTPGLYDNYINIASGRGEAEFRYVFQFDEDIVKYEYVKDDDKTLVSERLLVNDNLFLYKEYCDNGEEDLCGVKEIAPTLNFSFIKDESILRYILNNAALSPEHSLYKMMQFVSNMLWYRNLDENRYIGYKSSSKDYYTFIFDIPNAMQEFQEILQSAGIDVALSKEKDTDGKFRLYASPSCDPLGKIPFYETASSGTRALYSYFYWKKTSPNLSLLFIDEFDAYYHFELAEAIQKELQTLPAQVITTSHNTNLLTNRIMRPDCYFILSEKRLVSFADATKRELREGHNLEKLYMSGEFNG